MKVIEIEGKLTCLEEFLHLALLYKDDIASFPLGFHPQFRKVYEKIQIVQCEDS